MTRLAGAAATAAVAVGLLAASARGAPPAAVATPVAITVVTDDVTPSGCAPRLREVLAEQLAGVGDPLTWWCRATGAPDAPLRGNTSADAGLKIWIDVAGLNEARVILGRGDGGSDRFVVRRIPLAGGLDEIGREEIAHIVRSGTLALLAGNADTLSRDQADAEISSWRRPSASGGGAPPRAPTAAPATGTPRTTQPRTPWHPIVTLGPAWSVLLFSPQIPVVHELALSAGLSAGSFGLWADAGRRLPATYQTDAVGVELAAWSLRMGVALRFGAPGPVTFGLGAGAGLDRISFSPRAGASTIAVAPADSYFAPSVRGLLSLDYRARAHLTLAVRLFCDVATQDIHYDFRDADGTTRRVVAPYALTPGVSLSVAWRS